MIAVAGTGYGQIDLADCRERGIVVSDLRGWCDLFVLGTCLRARAGFASPLVGAAQTAGDTTGTGPSPGHYIARILPAIFAATPWELSALPYRHAVASLAKAFRMKVLAAERKGSASIRSGRIEFSRVPEQSDIVSLHCPLTDETRYLIGEDELRSMKRDAILINCAHGAPGQYRPLPRGDRRIIGGAGLDDVEVETPANQLPNLRLPNFL